MEYNRYEEYDNYLDDPSIIYEFEKLSDNSAYVVLNRGIDVMTSDAMESGLMSVDVNRCDVYRFRLFEEIRLRESSEVRLSRKENVVIEEGYVVYDRTTEELSFAGIHRVNGTNYTYQIKYVYRNNEFQPQIISYIDGIALEITMRLDKDMNIIQVYSDYMGPLDTESKILGSCPLNSTEPNEDTDGTIIIGSKDIDVMVALSYIISNEITLLRKLGRLMIDLEYISNYIIP